jgi:hypothetical protein
VSIILKHYRSGESWVGPGLSSTVSGQPFPVLNLCPIALTVINESINNMSMLILDPLVVAVLSPSEVCTLRPVATRRVKIKAVLGTNYMHTLRTLASLTGLGVSGWKSQMGACPTEAVMKSEGIKKGRQLGYGGCPCEL